MEHKMRIIHDDMQKLAIFTNLPNDDIPINIVFIFF